MELLKAEIENIVLEEDQAIRFNLYGNVVNLYYRARLT